MSRIGIEVTLRTPAEIAAAAEEARRKLFIGNGRLVLDMEWMFEKLVTPIYGVELDVRGEDDPELDGAHASFDVKAKVVNVRQSVLLRCQAEDPDAIFTMCHELGHICMHGNPLLFRKKNSGTKPGHYMDPEWQADRFAMEFATDRRLLETYDTPASAATYFRMPESKMRLFLSQLRHEGVLIGSTKTQMDRAFEIATQGGFDF